MGRGALLSFVLFLYVLALNTQAHSGDSSVLTDYFSSSQTTPLPLFALVVDPGNMDFNHVLGRCGKAKKSKTSGVWMSWDPQWEATCKPGEEGLLLVSTDRGTKSGHGVLGRLWLTGVSLFDLGRPAAKLFKNEQVVFWVDGVRKYSLKLSELTTGLRQSPFSAPTTTLSSGAVVIRSPVLFKKTLRIFLEQFEPTRLYYYQAAVHREVPQDQIKEKADPTGGTEIWKSLTLRWRSSDRIDPSQVHLELTGDSASHFQILLSDWIGPRENPRPFESGPVKLIRDGDFFQLTWSAPLLVSAKAEWVVSDPRMETLITDAESAHAAGLRVVAQVSQFDAKSTVALEQRGWKWLNWNRGKGELLGWSLSVQGKRGKVVWTQQDLAVLESDSQIVIDQKTKILGTGIEDDFDGGWYFRDGLFSNLWVVLHEIKTVSDGGGFVSANRWWHVNDRILFNHSIEGWLELGGSTEPVLTQARSVAFIIEK